MKFNLPLGSQTSRFKNSQYNQLYLLTWGLLIFLIKLRMSWDTLLIFRSKTNRNWTKKHFLFYQHSKTHFSRKRNKKYLYLMILKLSVIVWNPPKQNYLGSQNLGILVKAKLEVFRHIELLLIFLFLRVIISSIKVQPVQNKQLWLWIQEN